MKHRISPCSLFLLLVAPFFLTSCAKTSYVSFEAKNSNETEPFDFARKVWVEYEEHPASKSPTCVIVRKPTTQLPAHERILEFLEKRVVAHTPRELRVITEEDLAFQAARMSIDIRTGNGWRKAAERAKCPFVLNARIFLAEQTNYIVWAQLRLGMELSLIDMKTNGTVWRARHVGRRAEGGPALSPVGFAINGALAGNFITDDDQRMSLLDDVLRRLFSTFPGQV